MSEFSLGRLLDISTLRNRSPMEGASPLDVDTLKQRPPIQGVTVGRRVYADGADPDCKQSFMSGLVAIVTMSLMGSAFHLYLGVSVLFFLSPWVRMLVVMALASLVLPASKWHAFRYSWVFQTWREYAKLSFITEHILDPEDDRGYLCCCVQHGVVPYASMAGAGMDERLFPDRNKYCVVSSHLFKLPGLRHVIGWMGGIPATRENIQGLLSPGRSLVFLYQGGLAECCVSSPEKERVFLKNRKGFVRMAVEGGHCLFPMYFFGQSDFLTLWCPKILSKVSRMFRVPIGFLYGRYWLPIPRQKPVLIVAGRPIDVGPAVPRDDPGFETRVAEVHRQFIDDVKRIFEQYKHEYGWGHKELEIL